MTPLYIVKNPPKSTPPFYSMKNKAPSLHYEKQLTPSLYIMKIKPLHLISIMDKLPATPPPPP